MDPSIATIPWTHSLPKIPYKGDKTPISLDYYRVVKKKKKEEDFYVVHFKD